MCPKCDQSLSKLHAIDWCNGHSERREPRLLHCVHMNVLLVSRVYKCDNGYEVLGHHSILVDRLSNAGLDCFIPFKLYHKTGFTMTLIKFTTSMLNAGCSLLQIDKMLLANRVATYYNIKEKFEILHQHHHHT